MKKITLFLLVFSFSFSFGQKSILQSGPMVGYCEMTEAVIWLQTTKNSTVKIVYSPADDPNHLLYSENYTTSKDVGYTYHIILDQLQPDKKYNYSVFIDEKK